MVKTPANAGALLLTAEFFGARPSGLTLPSTGALGVLTGDRKSVV
jgi:hypothetical protein